MLMCLKSLHVYDIIERLTGRLRPVQLISSIDFCPGLRNVRFNEH